MTALLVGYLVGSRGFAQFFLLPNFPLLPAETGLLICVPVLVLRLAFKQTTALVRDGLNFAILAWILMGAARLPLDLRRYGLVALRDFAMVYYASFFFIAQASAGMRRHAACSNARSCWPSCSCRSLTSSSPSHRSFSLRC